MSDLERNKSNVIAFYDPMFNKCEPRRAVELYVGASTTPTSPRERPASSSISRQWRGSTPASQSYSSA